MIDDEEEEDDDSNILSPKPISQDPGTEEKDGGDSDALTSSRHPRPQVHHSETVSNAGRESSKMPCVRHEWK